MSTQYLFSNICISRLFRCMSLGFLARGYGLAAPSSRLLRANLPPCIIGRPSLTPLCWVAFGAWLLGRSNCDCVWLAEIPPLLCIEIGR